MSNKQKAVAVENTREVRENLESVGFWDLKMGMNMGEGVCIRDTIKALQDLNDRLVEEFPEYHRFYLECHYDDGLYAYGVRYENYDERLKREKKKALFAAQQKKQKLKQEERDREEYERLKKKFGE